MSRKLAGNKRKPSIMFGLILLAVCVYLGYSIGLMENSGTLGSREWMQGLLYNFLHPLPLLWNDRIQYCVAAASSVAVMMWVYYARGIRQTISGREYGTAKFIRPEIITKRLGKPERTAKILGEKCLLSTDSRKTHLNNNLLLIGGSGAGKSFRFVKPNILQCNGSMVITDPKGELLRDTGAYLKKHGYTVRVLNLVDPHHSDSYNPLAYIRKQDDVVKLVNILLKNTKPKEAVSNTDPFWENAENLYLQALIFYVWLSPRMEGKRNLKSVVNLMDEASVPENEKEKSELDKRMDELLEQDWTLKDPVTGKQQTYRGKDHPAYKTYRKVRVGAVDTVRSIIISANSRLAFLLNSPEILDLLSEDTIRIPELGTGVGRKHSKVALYCIIPDADTTYNAIPGMLYSQIFQELYFQADHKTKNGRLNIPVSLWMDEFSNIAMPADFTGILATMRSREISANIVIQNLSQLKEKYEKNWEVLTGNCDTLIYLGGNEQSTHKYISEMLGKWTAEKRSISQSSGKNGNVSLSDDVLGRELMTPDEVRMMDNRKEIVLIRGQYPVICRKYRTERDWNFREAARYKPYLPSPRKKSGTVASRHRIQIMLKNQPPYKPGANAIVTSLAQLRRLDPQGKGEQPPIQVEYSFPELDAAQEKGGPETNAIKDDASQVIPNSKTKGETDGTGEPDSIRDRITKYDYTDEQLQEAVMASADGLSESQILEWFVPDNSPKKMELSRKMQMQELHRKAGIHK